MSYAQSMSRYDPYGGITEDEELAEGSYLQRHWRGQLPLARSYWVNGVAVNIILTIAALVATGFGTSRYLQAFAWAFLGLIALTIVLRTWSLVGIWRSAGRHAARGGSTFWGFVARIMVVLGVLVFLAQTPALWLQTKEFAQIAVGRDPIGQAAALSVSKDGSTIDLDGYIVAGSVSDLADVLDQAPGVKLIRLASQGGRIAPALDMADMIRERGLETRVDSSCESACTLLFLAGKLRTASPIAQVGFHQPDFPGVSPQEREAMIAENRSDYVSAGIDRSFVDRIMKVPPNEIWYPGHQELIDAGVLTDIVAAPEDDPRQAAQLVRILDQIVTATNAEKGAMVDELTRLDNARREGRMITVDYTINAPGDFSRAQAEKIMREELHPGICGDHRAALVHAGAGFRFRYRTKSGETFADVTIDRCGKAQG